MLVQGDVGSLRGDVDDSPGGRVTGRRGSGLGSGKIQASKSLGAEHGPVDVGGEVFHGLLGRGGLHITERHVAGGVDQDAGERGSGRRRAHFLLQRGKGRFDRLRRRDVALIGADIVSNTAVAGLEQLVSTGSLERGVENGQTSALLAEPLAYAGAKPSCANRLTRLQRFWPCPVPT